MVRRIKFALLGLACLLVLPTTVAPAMAASPSNPLTPRLHGVTSGTVDQLQTLIDSLPAPTTAQLAAAKAFAAKHPFQGTVSIQNLRPPSTGGRVGVTPNIAVGVNWWGYYMWFSQQDVHNLWDIIWAAGIGTAAATLCSPGGGLAILCAIGAGFVAYVVAELIWNYIGYWVPGCGVHIGITYGGNWFWGYC